MLNGLKFLKKSVEESWSCFKTLAAENIKNYVPLVSVTKKSSAAPWFGKKCRVACKTKLRAWKNYQFSGDPQFLRKYLAIRNNCSKTLAFERKSFENSLGKRIKENPKNFWSYVNSTFGHSGGINSIENEHKIVTNDPEIVNTFSEFFSTTFVNEPDGTLPNPPVWEIKDTLGTLNSPTLAEISTEIAKLKPGKSCGPDNLPIEFLQGVKNTIALPLKLLFTKSIETSTLPRE